MVSLHIPAFPRALPRREGISRKAKEKSPGAVDGSARQLWWTFLKNKYPLSFQSILSSVG